MGNHKDGSNQKDGVIWPKMMGAGLISALRWNGGSCPASAVGYIYQQAPGLGLRNFPGIFSDFPGIFFQKSVLNAEA